MSGNHFVKPSLGGIIFSHAVHFFLGFCFLHPWLRFGLRGRIKRSRNVPTGPVVLACNHRSYFDPPFVGMCFTGPIAYFARSNLWDYPVIAWFLRVMYGIPVDRDNPGLSSMKGAVERLKGGISILVFPEGTRTKNGRLSRLRDGPALFARRAHVPVVPVYLHRSEAVWPRGHKLPVFITKNVEVRLGAPIIAPTHLSSKEQDAWVSHRLAAWMELQERKFLGPRPKK